MAEVKMFIRRCVRLLAMGKNFPRTLKFENDDSTLFKPEPPKFKLKKVVEGS